MDVSRLENIHLFAVKIIKARSIPGLQKVVDDMERYLGRDIEMNIPLSGKMPLSKRKEFLLFNVIYREQVGIYKNKTLPPLKRGIKGSKVKRAFLAITDKKVPFSAHARKYGITENVLMQSSRFDLQNPGKIRTKTIDGIKMIWREFDD